MNLRYISLFMGYESGLDEEFSNRFDYNTRFISNYLSLQVRKLKFQTDGTFKMLSVSPVTDPAQPCRIVGDDALQVKVQFNSTLYGQLRQNERPEYYLQLLEQGYQIAAQYKKIPFEELLKIHQDFREKEYKNEWLHVRKRFKEQDIEVLLNGLFTSFDFRLVMTVIDLKTKSVILSGTVIRTKPDELHYAPLLGNLKLNGDSLVINEKYDRPKFVFSLTDILAGRFSFEVLDNGLEYVPYEDNLFRE